MNGALGPGQRFFYLNFLLFFVNFKIQKNDAEFHVCFPGVPGYRYLVRGREERGIILKKIITNLHPGKVRTCGYELQL